MPEIVDEKKVVEVAAPGTASRPGGGVRQGYLVLVVLAGLSWGLSAAFLLSFAEWLGKPTLRLTPSGQVGASAGGLGAGLLLGVALVVGLMKMLAARLTLTKPGQGSKVRLSAYVGIGAMALFGAYSLYMVPPASSSWWGNLTAPLMIFGKALSLKPVLFPAAAVFATAMLGVHLLLNREVWTDFLVETEGEIKKVSWPARKEYLGSSLVVVLVVAVVSAFLYFVDLGLSWLMRQSGIGF